MRPLMWLLPIALCVAGCSSRRAPNSFSPVPPAWATIEIRDGVEYSHAWSIVWSTVSRDFDIEFASRDDGYLRTAWLYTWTGVYQPNYRVRITAKFSDDRKMLSVKAEAQALSGTQWLVGVDSRLVSTLKSDIMGTIGRTAR